MDSDTHDVWQEDGEWWTNYPPPAGFGGAEEGEYEDGEEYRRTLSPEEQAVVDSLLAEERAAGRALGEAQRLAHFFGIAADGAEPALAPPSEPPSRPAD